MTDKMREEFEEWVIEKHPILMLLESPRGSYMDCRTEAYWEVWQASRQAMLVQTVHEAVWVKPC